MKRFLLFLAAVVVAGACGPAGVEGQRPDVSPEPIAADESDAAQQEPPPQSELEAERASLLSKWGAEGVPQPREVGTKAEEVLSRPLEQQSVEELMQLADEANRAANFVNFILEEYADYYRQNYRYEFVQKKVAPFHDGYVELSNRLKGYRDQAYFNLGLKHKAQGNTMRAFFYFRDAFRLSPFDEDAGDHKGLRYQAEGEMKKLLGIEDLGTYVYWK